MKEDLTELGSRETEGFGSQASGLETDEGRGRLNPRLKHSMLDKWFTHRWMPSSKLLLYESCPFVIVLSTIEELGLM